MKTTDQKIAKMLSGERVIVDDEWFDSVLDSDIVKEICSCHNRNRLGIRDQYVAWIGDENKPPDLEFADNRAIGSK